MRRTTRTWTAFGACAAAVLAALAGITYVSLDLDVKSRVEARYQELIRLALWRMDSALAPVIAREAARPYFHYAPFYQENLAFNQVRPAVERAAVLIPSPLLNEPSEFFKLHFQMEPGGAISSPQAPVGAHCALALGNDFCTGEGIEGKRALLGEVAGLVSFNELLGKLEAAELDCVPAMTILTAAEEPPPPAQSQQKWTAQEFNIRQMAANRAAQSPQQRLEVSSSPSRAVKQGGFLPLWCGRGQGGTPQLIFARLVTVGSKQSVQGMWTDWPKLQEFLVAEVKDLLPQAALAAALPGGAPQAGRLLANVPAMLEPGVAPLSPMPLWTPARVTLIAAWAAILAAVTAAAVVLGKAMDLGERRGRFVSAVTHELRTPLTTFRLYSQMLADGMVSEEARRREYFATLKEESERLARVVENVLLYARVEENGKTARREPMPASGLLERLAGRLTPLAAEKGRELVVGAADLDGAVVVVDPQAVEQILLNLVDNSIKYAAGAADTRLHLEARAADLRLEIHYSDHGPGIPRGEEANVFCPFQRGTAHQSGTIPGIGLGLALARGLARQLGGDLELCRREGDGAVFRLWLSVES